ncbi:MAG: hypothetical protein ACYTKD_27240 [Planctomycetota bacterium]|jgi:hypothetical protein
MFSGSREEVRRAVFGEVDEEGFQPAFELIRESAPPLCRFASPADLVTFLHRADASAFEEKDAVLHALISAANAAGGAGGGARLLLLAAMWPALDNSFFRLFPLLSGEQDPFAEVYWAFLEEVRNWKPEKRDRVAANLQRNTEKRVRTAVRLERRYQAARQDAATAAASAGPQGLLVLATLREGTRRTEADRAEAEEALAELTSREVITESQRRLIVRHALDGEPLKSIAGGTAASHRAVIMRYERAVEKVRNALRKKP